MTWRVARALIWFVASVILVMCVEQRAAAQTVYWVRQLGVSRDDAGLGVSADGIGGTYICGNTHGTLGVASAGNLDAFVGRYDSDGTLLWLQQIGSSAGDTANAVSARAENVYVAGTTTGALFSANSKQSADTILLKYNMDGALLWSRQFGTPDDDYAMGVATNRLGDVYISGYTTGSFGGAHVGIEDAFVAKYDDSGNLLWTRQLGTSQEDESTAVASDRYGNVFITGYTRGSITGTAAAYEDAFVAKYDGSGNLLWTRQFGAHLDIGSRTVGYALSTDVDGNVYLAGETTENIFGYSEGGAILCKFDAGGNLLWGKELALDKYAFGYGVANDGLASIYVSGRNPNGPNLFNPDDAFVSKYDGAGNLVWTQQIGTTSEDYSWRFRRTGSETCSFPDLQTGIWPPRMADGMMHSLRRFPACRSQVVWASS